MKTFSIKEAFNQAWTLFKTHKKVLILATLIAAVIEMTINYDSDGQWFPLAIILAIIFTAIGLWIQIGYLKIILGVIDGNYPKLKELFAHANLIWPYFLVIITYCLVILAGFILLIIPGIYLAIRYIFAPLLVIDQRLSVGRAFKESASMTDGVKWKILGLLFIMAGINIIGALALVVGLLVSIPTSYLMYVYIYRHLLASGTQVA